MVTVIPFLYNDEELKANAYLIKDKDNKCVVVDPGNNNDKLGDYIEKNNLKLIGILLTHAHVDHMRGTNRLVERFKCNVYVGFDDEIGFTDEEYNCAIYLNESLIVKATPCTVADKQILRLLDENIEVIYTPFHTKGSVCYYLCNSKIIFSGDTLFKGVIGRTDLYSSTRAPLRASLAKLKLLPDDVKVYPGHGEFTSIGFEKVNNVFLNR